MNGVPVPIETERLRLRLVCPADAAEMSRLMTPEISAFVSNWPLPFTRERAIRRIAEMVVAAITGRVMPLAIVRRADEAFLGYVSVRRNDTDPRLAGMGYWLGAEFHGQGYMREAILALVHHAFTVMDLSRIEAACLPENAASRGVLEKCGFKYEGVAQSYMQIAGRWRNHVLYANLRNDRRGRTDVG